MLEADQVFRDYNVDGVSASGAFKPIKKEIRELLADYRQALRASAYDIKGDGSDEIVKLEALFFDARRATPSTYAPPVTIVDLEGLTISVSRTLTLIRHAGVYITNGALKAIGTGWATSDYLIDATGENATANMALVIDIALLCEKKCEGLRINNGFRSRTGKNFRVNKYHTMGLDLGSNLGLGIYEGTLHEWETNDSGYSDSAQRIATGVHFSAGAGDTTIDLKIGWTHRQIFNEATGPVIIKGHCYGTTFSGTPIESITYEGASTAGFANITELYMDSGRLIYRGGVLLINPTAFGYRLPGQIHANDSNCYIEMISPANGTYHQVLLPGPMWKSDRTVPLMKVTGPYTWANLPTNSQLLFGSLSHMITHDPLVMSCAAASQYVVGVQSSVTTCLVTFQDSTTTTRPSFGCDGDNLIAYVGGAVGLKQDIRQNLGIGRSPVDFGSTWRTAHIAGTNCGYGALADSGLGALLAAYPTFAGVGTTTNHDFVILRNNTSAVKFGAGFTELLGAQELRINGTKVVGARDTGWGAVTGTTSKAAYDASTSTTTQDKQTIAGILTVMKAHGLID